MNDELIPPRVFLRNCRKNSKAPKIADSMGEELTGRDVLLRTFILRRLLLREVLEPGEKYVGILIPPSCGAAIVNAAIPLTGRIGVNLNYTLTEKEMQHCINECGIRHVLTTRRVVEKLDVKLDNLVFLDDLRPKITTADKIAAALQAVVLPIPVLERMFGLHKLKPDDVLTVIFTSGSTNLPKGVMLTHRNIGSNVGAVNKVIRLRDDDVLLGTLPFFHSFGYTVTLWTALMLSPRGVYHFSPLDAKIVGRMCERFKVTLLISTPTFLRGYLKRCKPEELASVEVVVAGAEKLPKQLCDAFEQTFKVRPVEGYGTTELSPLVSVNIPPDRAPEGAGVTLKEGSVGRPVPGVKARVVSLETGEVLGPDQEGMLQISGPNVMLGYLNHPEKTAEVIRDGWYTTGDIARIDADGFIYITGRESRFSKIGGEMVPHLKVEEELHRLLTDDEDQVCVAVTAVPDERKGERLVVFHLPTDKTPQELCRQLAEAGLPNLFIPSPDSFREVQEIPVLGSGKLDLKRLREMALKEFGPGTEKEQPE